MVHSSSVNKRKNKSFVINNKFFLKEYALKNHKFWGDGVIVVNLLLLKTDIYDDIDIGNYQPEKEQELTVHHPVAYIPKQNFWFKMLNLKIKKKYQIDLEAESSVNNKCLVVFIKDASIEHFSIYSLKLNNEPLTSDY